MKLNAQELKYGAHAVFDTKDKALNYIKKTSFNKSSKDKVCMIYRRRKWIVWWE